jgi:hypothetical protein
MGPVQSLSRYVFMLPRKSDCQVAIVEYCMVHSHEHITQDHAWFLPVNLQKIEPRKFRIDKRKE